MKVMQANNVSKFFQGISESKFMQNHMTSVANDPTKAARLLVVSGVTKDVVSYMVRYNKSRKNEEIPEDKRKFVAALDLASGFTTCAVQLLLGFGISNRKLQKAISQKLFGHIKDATKHIDAKEGFIQILSLFFAGVIGERVIVPIIASQVASKVKEKVAGGGEQTGTEQPKEEKVVQHNKPEVQETQKQIFKGFIA